MFAATCIELCISLFLGYHVYSMFSMFEMRDSRVINGSFGGFCPNFINMSMAYIPYLTGH
jgi:hypothetical protein